MAETITSTIEDYLGLIYIMQREGQEVIGARLAERLGVSHPTVTATLKRMLRGGLIQMNERKEITLTPRGLQIAQDLLRRHMLTEWLLCDVIGLPWHLIHEEADRLEHYFSEEAIACLEELFEQPNACPHGNPMPGVASPAAVALSEVAEGERGTIVRVVEEAEEDRELMAFLEEAGLLPGAQVRVVTRRPYNETITVEVIDAPMPIERDAVVLGLSAAQMIRVRLVERAAPKENQTEAERVG